MASFLAKVSLFSKQKNLLGFGYNHLHFSVYQLPWQLTIFDINNVTLQMPTKGWAYSLSQRLVRTMSGVATNGHYRCDPKVHSEYNKNCKWSSKDQFFRISSPLFYGARIDLYIQAFTVNFGQLSSSPVYVCRERRAMIDG